MSDLPKFPVELLYLLDAEVAEDLATIAPYVKGLDKATRRLAECGMVYDYCFL